MAKAKKEEAEKKDAEEEAKPEAAAEGAEGAPAEGAEGEAAAAEGGGKKKLFIIIGGVVVLLIGAGAGLYFTGMLDSLLGKEAPVECAEGDHECEEKAAAAAEHGEKAGAKGGHGEKKEAKGGGHGEAGGASDSFVAIPTMIVNLNSDDGTPRYLRLTVQLELEDAADKAAVEAIIPKVIDQFQTYLRELRVRDLRGSGGIYRLQMELLWRVNQAAAPVEVKDVLFQEILIQ
ncbi:MAG: flagellar basal body protein FliL [Alphaproteobacteria bacterium PRO2]|nr:flagellar basal body protein FliL [Alphaproteobacteria bacterium PRO2]